MADSLVKQSGIPLSSSWGQHVCTYVAGTAVALASAAIRPNKPCRGRCLLEQNGTIEESSTATDSKLPASHDPPPADSTGLPQLNNSETIANTTLEDKSTPSSSTGALPFRIPSGFPSPLSSEPTHQTSPDLNCPCNCTYVSAACCLSQIVWEDPANQIQIEPPPANASVYCDTGSGRWESKILGPSRGASNHNKNNDNGSATFESVGSVRYNDPGTSPKPSGLRKQPGL